MKKVLIDVLCIGGIAAIPYFLLVRPYLFDKRLEEDGQYVNGRIINWESAAEGNGSFTYTFNFDNKNYKGTFVEDSRYEKHVGDCVLIRFYTPDPTQSKVIMDKIGYCD